MVKNKTSNTLLIVGFAIWLSAIMALPFSSTAYFMLTAAAIATFLSAVAVGVFLKRAEHRA